jgi:hypothetical protein
MNNEMLDPLQDTPSLPKQEGTVLPLRELLNCPDLTPAQPPKQEGENPVDCKSPTGKTIGLIDSLIAIANVLVMDDFLYQDGIEDALADLRESDNMKRLMNIGELSDAKDYIKELQNTINVQSKAFSELAFRFTEQSSPKQEPEEDNIAGTLVLDNENQKETFIPNPNFGKAKQEPDGPVDPEEKTLEEKFAGHDHDSMLWHIAIRDQHLLEVNAQIEALKEALEKQNVHILGHIKKRQDLEAELSQALIKIEEQKKWHDSHI